MWMRYWVARAKEKTPLAELFVRDDCIVEVKVYRLNDAGQRIEERVLLYPAVSADG